MGGGDDGASDARDASIQAAEIAAKQAERSSKRAIKFLKQQDLIAEERALAGEERAAGELDPTIQAGNLGRNALLNLLGLGTEEGAQEQISLLDTPQSRFAREQAEKAQSRSAAARSGLLSGRQQIAVQELSNNLSNANFNQRFEQLRTLSGAGDVASSNLANIRARTGQQTSQQAQQLGGQVAGVETQLGENLANIELAKGEAISSAFLAQDKPSFLSSVLPTVVGGVSSAFGGPIAGAAGSALASSIFG